MGFERNHFSQQSLPAEPKFKWIGVLFGIGLFVGNLLTDRYVLPQVNPHFADRWVVGQSFIVASVLFGIGSSGVMIALGYKPSQKLTWRSAIGWAAMGLTVGVIISMEIRGLEIGSGHVR